MHIPLPDGQTVIIDNDDLCLVQGYRWHAMKTRSTTYAQCSIYAPHRVNKRATIYMHRLILGAKDGKWVDHRNGNGLDNRRENIRICTPAENLRFRRARPSKSGYKGVRKLSPTRWQARITLHGKRKHIGIYPTPEEAHEAYKRVALQNFGEFAKFK